MESDPNILCISIDSLRKDYCSFLETELETTPFLESFAERSATYPHAISPSIWTLPVHTSIFTGLYPPEHQVQESGVVLGSHPAFAELLSEEGYQTKSFGYNGWLHQGDILRGFDIYNPDQPTLNSNNTVQKTGNLIEQVFGQWTKEKISTVYNGAEELRRRARKARFPNDWLDETTAETVEIHLSEVSEPFCYFVHFNDTHRTYTPPSPSHRKFGDHSAVKLFWHRFYWHEKIDNSNEEIISGDLNVPDETIEVMRDLYKGCIYRIDQLVQSIVDRLKAEGLLQNTIIVLFGDHGDYLGEDGLFGHNNSHAVSEALYRVPLLIRDPTGQLSHGEQTETVQLNDLYPTILDLCDVSYPETNSTSLLAQREREFGHVYFRARDSSYSTKKEVLSTETMPPKRQYAIWSEPGEELTWDPDGNSYWGSKAGNNELHEELHKHYERLEPVTPDAEGVEIEDHVMDRIEQMGYIN